MGPSNHTQVGHARGNESQVSHLPLPHPYTTPQFLLTPDSVIITEELKFSRHILRDMTEARLLFSLRGLTDLPGRLCLEILEQLPPTQRVNFPRLGVFDF